MIKSSMRHNTVFKRMRRPRTIMALRNTAGHIRSDPISLAPAKAAAYLPGPNIGQPLDLHSLRLELRVQQRTLPLQTPDNLRIAHGRAPSVFALAQDMRTSTDTPIDRE